jgi:hypothetical protein
MKSFDVVYNEENTHMSKWIDLPRGYMNFLTVKVIMWLIEDQRNKSTKSTGGGSLIAQCPM